MPVDLEPAITVQRTIAEDLIPYEEPDPQREYKAHIVNPPANTHIWQPGMEAQDVVDVARVKGLEVVALCGYKFIPKHNPDKFDACEACMKIAGDIMREAGE